MTQDTHTPMQDTAIKGFGTVLDSYREPLEASLKRNNIIYEKFKDHVLNAIRENTKLLGDQRESLLGAIFSAANLGLYPNTRLNLCYLRRMFDKRGQQTLVKLEIGYQGWLEIINRNPEVLATNCQVWREGDTFEYELGLKPILSHKPIHGDRLKRKPLGVYAGVLFKNEATTFTVIFADEIEVIKKMALERDPYGIWSDESLDVFKWMWKKTAIKQLAKELPKMGGSGEAIEHDNLIETGGYVVLNRAGKPIIVDNKGFEQSRRSKAKSKKINDQYKNTLFGK